MKKICSVVLAVIMLFGLMAPVQLVLAAEEKTAQALNLTPVVDGNISEWVDDTQYALNTRVVDGEAATTGWYKIRWDGSAIYVAGQITDATKEDYNDQIKFLFSFDGVPTGETALDFSYVPKGGVYSWTPVGYNPNGNSLNMGNWNPENAYGNNQNAGAAIMGDGVNYSMFYCAHQEGVYTFESSWYPTDELKAFLTAGREIGFDLRWNDFNNGSSLTTIGWASDEVDWNSDLRKIGKVTLKGEEAAEPTAAVAVAGTPTVDGDISDWSAVENKYELNQRVIDGTADTTGYFQVMWDADYLYMAGEIYDTTNETGNDLLKVLFDMDGVPAGDAVVTFADRANAGVHTNSSAGYNPNGGANAWNPLNAWNGYLNPGNTVVAGYDSYISYVEGSGKYVFEIKWYPTDAMKAKLSGGATIGLDVQWSDYNNGTYADDPVITTIGWSSQLVDWNNDLRTIGSLTMEAQKIAEEYKADAVYGTPAVDGDISDWSAVQNKYELNQRVIDGTADTTGYFQVMWDADYLYMAGEICDATNEAGNDLLKVLFDMDGVPTGDAVVTFADRANAGVHTTSSTGYNPNGGANAWNPLNAWNGYLNPGNTVVAGYDSFVNYVEDAQKYVFEIKWYPTETMKAKLISGATIGLDVQWSDYNNGTYADDPVITTIGWSSKLVDWNNDLRTIGSLTLAAVPAQMKGWNISLKDNIGVNFYVQLDDADVANAQVDLTVGGQTASYPAANAQKNPEGLYVFTAQMAAAQMTDSIGMALIVNGETLHADSYTIRMYAEHILTSGDFDAATKQLVKEMVNYGAKAQQYFDYKTEKLVSEDLDLTGAGAQQIPGECPVEQMVSGSVSGVQFYGASMVFRSKIAVRYYFDITGTGAYTFTVNGRAYTPEKKGDLFYIEIADINPQDYSQATAVEVGDGTDVLTAAYCPMNYIVRKSESSDSTELNQLLLALYNYHLAAAAYQQ